MKLSHLLVGSAMLACAGVVQAVPVTVVNGTFDVINNPVNSAPITVSGAAGYVYTDKVGTNQTLNKSVGSTGPDSFDIPGWTSNAANNTDAGIEALGTDLVTPGTNSGLGGYINNADGSTVIKMSQILTDVLVADSTYTLSLASAYRSQGDPGSLFKVQLWAGATQLINQSPTLTQTFQNFSFQYISPSSGAEIGQTLEIRFESTAKYKQALIDNVTLDVVPEPAALSLLGLSGLSLLARRKCA